MTPDIVLLGNLIVDDLVFPDGRTRMGEPGGALLYTALGAILWGARVAVVAPVGNDYPKATLEALSARGVDLSGLRPLGRQGLRTWLLYESGARRVVHQAGSPTHEEASPAPSDIAPRFGDVLAFHLSPTPLATQAALVSALQGRRGRLVSLDPHDPITEARFEEWRTVLRDVDFFFASDEEILLDGMERDPHAGLRRLAAGRLRGIALKAGARGGIFLDVAEKCFVDWPGRSRSVVDPTGSGDAFAGGFLAGWLRTSNVITALEQGVVSASFALEGWGAAGLFQASREEAARRLREWFGEGPAPHGGLREYIRP